jgi:hypothetical protein
VRLVARPKPLTLDRILFERQFEGTDPMEGLAFASSIKLADGSYNCSTLSTAHVREGTKSISSSLRVRLRLASSRYKIVLIAGQSGSAVEPSYY